MNNFDMNGFPSKDLDHLWTAVTVFMHRLMHIPLVEALGPQLNSLPLKDQLYDALATKEVGIKVVE